MLGIDHNVEHEGVDVENTTLPGLQESFALQVMSKAKKTVLILIGDDCNSIDSLVDGTDAIIKAFYPSTQGELYCGVSNLCSNRLTLLRCARVQARKRSAPHCLDMQTDGASSQ